MAGTWTQDTPASEPRIWTNTKPPRTCCLEYSAWRTQEGPVASDIWFLSWQYPDSSSYSSSGGFNVQWGWGHWCLASAGPYSEVFIQKKKDPRDGMRLESQVSRAQAPPHAEHSLLRPITPAGRTCLSLPQLPLQKEAESLQPHSNAKRVSHQNPGTSTKPFLMYSMFLKHT